MISEHFIRKPVSNRVDQSKADYREALQIKLLIKLHRAITSMLRTLVITIMSSLFCSCVSAALVYGESESYSSLMLNKAQGFLAKHGTHNVFSAVRILQEQNRSFCHFDIYTPKIKITVEMQENCLK